MKKGSIQLFRALFAALLMAIILTLESHTALAETQIFATGWEDEQERGLSNKVQYSKDVAGYFNSANPPPESDARPNETVLSGSYSLLLGGLGPAPGSPLEPDVCRSRLPGNPRRRVGSHSRR